MGRLLVVACGRCRRAKVVERGRKTTSCPVCNRTLHLASLRILFETDEEAEAREAIGRLNARIARREDEFVLPPSRTPAPPSTRREAAHRAMRLAPAPVRFEEAARALGEFDASEWAALFAEAGIEDDARTVLHALLGRRVLFEPRPGRYRTV